MRVGTAWREITPQEPIPLGGQMHVRLGERTRDLLTVNAAAFAGSGERLVLVSCDLCLLPEAFVEETKKACARAYDLDADRLLIACTHTHVAPVTVDWLPGAVKPWFMEHLREAIAEAVGAALADLEKAQLHAGSGYLQQMGWNRRGLRRDGTAEMYWGSWREDFAGIEGERDGQVPVIFARRTDGSIKLVLPSFSTHPNCVEGECYYSADLPGEVRRVLRADLGEDVGVVYLTGAAGDTAPSIMEDNPDNRQPWRGEEGLKRSGRYLGGEILKVIAESVDPMPNQDLALRQEILQIPLRPWPEDFDPQQLSPGFREFFAQSHAEWPGRMAKESPVAVPVSVLRLGGAAICTNPSELYCHFGLKIKENSPAAVTAVAELVDGCAGYIPTPDAIERGGYSAYPGRQCQLAPDAGDRIVEATQRMLAEVF